MVFRYCALIFALLTLSSFANAEPTADEKEQARGHMDLGRKNEAKGDFQAALEAYQAADKIMNVPSTSLSVGAALAKVGRLIEARDRLLAVARSQPEDDEPSAYANARARAKELAQELAVRIPSVRVEVVSSTGDPVDAQISIAGKTLDADARKLPMRVDPGTVKIEVSAADHSSAARAIEIEEGEHHVVSLVLVAGQGDAQTELVVSPFAYVGLGLFVGGAIAGAALGSAALAKSATLEESCPGDVCPAELEGSADSMQLMAHISTASFALAGAGAALAVIGFVLLSGDEPIDDVALDASGLTIRF